MDQFTEILNAPLNAADAGTTSSGWVAEDRSAVAEDSSAGPADEPNFFERKGCSRLALALLRDSVQMIREDPELLREQTRQELLWLRGQDCGGVTAAEVFEALGLQAWSERFVDELLADPVGMEGRLTGVRKLADDIGADAWAAESMGDAGERQELLAGFSQPDRRMRC